MHTYKGVLMFVDYEMSIDMQVCHSHDLTSQLERMQNPSVTPYLPKQVPIDCRP